MPAKGSGVQEEAFLAAVIEANTSPMNVDWNKVASLIDYGSAKSASTRFGIIRKRWGFTKPIKAAHVGSYAGKVTKARASANGATTHASRAKPGTSIKKVVGGPVRGERKKLPQKVEDDGHDESGQDEKIRNLMAPFNDVEQNFKYDALKDEKQVHDLMSISDDDDDDDDDEQEQESFQSQVSRGLYDEPNAEENEGKLSDGAVEPFHRQIAQQQEARLQTQTQMSQQGVYEEYDSYEPGAFDQNARDKGQYHEHMVQGVTTYYK